MLHWLPTLLVASLAWRATALATAPSVEHLAVYEAGRRTVDHGRSVAAEVAGRGQVSVQLRDEQSGSDLAFSEGAVYGSLMLLVDEPPEFARSSAAQSAAQRAIADVAAVGRSVKSAGVVRSLVAASPAAVRVDFHAAFHQLGDRQAFILDMLKSTGSKLADSICEKVPDQRCQLPRASQTATRDSDSTVDLLGIDAKEAGTSVQAPEGDTHGSFLFKPNATVAQFFRRMSQQEAVAQAVADVAWVSRVQVGTMMAVETEDTVRVHFWVTIPNRSFRQAAIQRVEVWSEVVGSLARERVSAAFWKDARSQEYVVFGRMGLVVPDVKFFAGNRTTEQAVETAISWAAVSFRKSAEGPRLTLTNVSAALVATENVTDSLRVAFQVGFGSRKDREIFTEGLASDGGKQLIGFFNAQLPVLCNGNCVLPAHEASPVPSRFTFGHPYGTFRLWFPDSRLFVSNPAVQHALTVAISLIARPVWINPQQVGLLLASEHRTRASVTFWVASSNGTQREVLVQRVGLAPRHRLPLCVLAMIDRDAPLLDLGDPLQGSISLQVADARRFANDTVVRNAVRSAIEQVANVSWSVDKATVEASVDISEISPQLVRVDFQMRMSRKRRQAFTWVVPRGGGEQLVALINERLPKPITCQLPGAVPLKASSVTPRPDFTQPFGSMFFYVFSPDVFVREQAAREVMAQTIAEVADVPRQQVGITAAVEAPTVVSLTFWILSTNSTLRQAAIQRVNKDWTNQRLVLAMERMKANFLSPAFMTVGGSVNSTDAVVRQTC